MKKKILIAVFFALFVFGSFITFYASNLFMSDVSNLTFGISNRPYYLFATLPMVMLAFIFTLALIFIHRFIRNPHFFKAMVKLYSIIFLAFSFVGLVSSILAGILVYHSFVGPNPFPGYCLFFTILFAIFIILGCVVLFVQFPKYKNEIIKRDIKGGYVLYTIMMSIMVFYAMNRFGAVLWMPTYFYARTFDLTWPFYLTLLLPILMLIQNFLYSFKWYKKSPKIGLISISVLLALFLGGSAYIFVMGYQNTLFLSAISPAVGGSRLLAKPISGILQFVIFGILGGYSLWHAITYYLHHKPGKEVIEETK